MTKVGKQLETRLAETGSVMVSETGEVQGGKDNVVDGVVVPRMILMAFSHSPLKAAELSGGETWRPDRGSAS